MKKPTNLTINLPFSKTSSFLNFARESFFSKILEKANFNKKPMLLDNIIPKEFFVKNLVSLYGEELGLYLAKYLTYWLNQKNPEGPYFLDFYQDYESTLYDKWLVTWNEVQDFGSAFSHVELPELNDLPANRNQIALIKILGKTIKFKKINHFFNFIELLKHTTGFGFCGSEIVHDSEEE